MIKKIIAVLLSLVTVFAFTVNGSAITKEEAEANLKAEIERKEKEIEQYQQKIDSLKDNAAKQDEYIEELQKQIHAYDDEIALLGKQISELNSKIATLDGEIAEFERKIRTLEETIESINEQIKEKKEEIDNAYKLFAARLRAVYMAGETSTVEIFLSASDFSDFIEKTELIYQISKHDNAIVEGLEESIADLNKMLKDLDEKKADLEESKVTLDNQRAKLDESRQDVKKSKAVVDQKVAAIQSKIDRVKNYIGTLNQQSAQYKKLMAAADKKMLELNTDLDRIQTSTGDGTVSAPTTDVHHNFEISTKGVICPIQGQVYISEYSWNHAKRGYHNVATDMASPKGTPIYSVADGKVLAAGFQSAGGNYLYVDHGNGLTTRYYHCSSLAVGTGAQVKQGQVIAYVGSTGTAATGNHLHFEVRVNGSQVAPENYLKRANGSYVKPLG